MDKIPIPNDWNEETDGYAFVWFCIPNSPLWRGVVRGKIYEMTRGRIWDEVTGNIKDTQAIAWEIYEGICMACSDELFDRLDRIAEALESTRAVLAPPTVEHTFLEYAQELEALGAGANAGNPIMVSMQELATSLENINQKAVERVTWEEFIEDLADTLGVTNALYGVIKWIGDLFPRVRVKMDFTTIALDLWEYFRWKMPIIALLTGVNTSLAAIAAAQVAEKPLSLIRTILAGFDTALNINNRIYDFVLGDWNWYDDVLKPLWNSYISDDEGGTGGDDPDADPANRNITRVYNDVFVEGDAINVTCAPDVTVNCGSGGGCGCGNLGSPSSGSLTDSDQAPDLGDPETDPPPTGFDSWVEYDDYKCRAANFLADATFALFEYSGRLETEAGELAGDAGVWLIEKYNLAISSFSTSTLLSSIAITALAGAALFTLPIWADGAIVAAIAACVVAAGMGAFVYFSIAAAELDKADLVCQLYRAQTVEEAKTALYDTWAAIIANIPIETPFDVFETQIRAMLSTVMGYVITNAFVNQLFEKNDIISLYTATTPCDGCATPGVFDFTVDEQGWLIDEANSTNGDYDAVNGYFWGSNTGVTDAVLYIYYPELVTISNFKAWVKGKQSGVNRVEIFEAESLDGPWTSVKNIDNISTPDFTMVELTDFNISNKYVKVHVRRFETDSTVYCQRIEWS